MRHATTPTKGIRGRNGRTRFPGICALAREFGVSRQHIYYVMTGQRKSPRIERLMARRKHGGRAA